MRRNSIIAALAVLFLVCSLVMAHPHLRKSVTVTLDGGTEVTVQFFTSPSNEDHAKNATEGAFSTGGAVLKLGADMMIAGKSLKAGDYAVGAIKMSGGKWVLALHEGQIGRGQSPDMSKVIKLESEFSTSMGTADHVNFDIQPGHGKMTGKPTLIWHFGSLYLAGALA